MVSFVLNVAHTVGAFAFLTALPAFSSAQSSFAYTVTSVHGEGDLSPYGSTLYCGVSFMVTEDRSVTAMPVFDDFGNGIDGSIYVGLYEVGMSHTPVMHGTVAGGTTAPLEGDQRLTTGFTRDASNGDILSAVKPYTALALVPANQNLGAHNTATQNLTPITAPWIQANSTYVTYRFSGTPTSAWNDDGYTYFDGNLKAEADPEPASMLVLPADVAGVNRPSLPLFPSNHP